MLYQLDEYKPTMHNLVHPQNNGASVDVQHVNLQTATLYFIKNNYVF